MSAEVMDHRVVNFVRDDLARMAIVALGLAILNQCAEDIALARRRAGPEMPESRGGEMRKNTLAMHGRVAEAFLRGAAAQGLCDLIEQASFGRLRVRPDYVATVLVRRLMQKGDAVARGTATQRGRRARAILS